MVLSGHMRRMKTGGVLIVIPAPGPESRGRGTWIPAPYRGTGQALRGKDEEGDLLKT